MWEHDATEYSFRNGYAKGYEEGKKDAVRHGRKIRATTPVTGVALTHQCMECGCYLLPLDDYCPNCGTLLDLED